MGSIEPQFYSELLEKLEIDDKKFLDQYNTELWSELKGLISLKIKSKTRYEWSEIFS